LRKAARVAFWGRQDKGRILVVKEVDMTRLLLLKGMPGLSPSGAQSRMLAAGLCRIVAKGGGVDDKKGFAVVSGW